MERSHSSMGCGVVGPLAPRRALRGMNDGKNVNLIWLQVVDDSVGPFDQFANLGQLELCHYATGQRKICDLLRAASQTINGSLSVLRRLLPNVGVDRPKMPERSVGPMNFHWDNLNSRRTSSTLRVRPASLSAKPDSMAWRT